MGKIGSETKGTKTQKSSKTLTKKVVMSESSTKQVAAKKKKVNSETIATTISAPKKHDQRGVGLPKMAINASTVQGNVTKHSAASESASAQAGMIAAALLLGHMWQ